MPHTALLSTAQIWSRLFERCGIEALQLWREVGVRRELLPEGPEARAPLRYLDAAILRVASRMPDESWGLQMARCWHPGNLGVLGHAWLASSTLRTGLTRLARYWRIVGTRARIGIDESGVGLAFSYGLAAENPVVERIIPDCWLSLVIDMCRVNAGCVITPVAVSLCRSAPADDKPWTAYYGCPIRFGADINSFTLSPADADRLLPTANRPLAGVFDRLLVEQLAALDRDDVVSRCKSEFLREMSSGEAAADDIARRLHMSGRTMQRKLAEAGTTYLRLVDDTRRDMALRYIVDPGKSLADIAFLLGFSEQSAFSRAFRRWTGASPTAYRQRAGVTASD